MIKFLSRNLFYLILLVAIGFLLRLGPMATYQKVINGEEAGFGNRVLILSGYIKNHSVDLIGRGYIHGFSNYLYVYLAKIFSPSLLWFKIVAVILNLLFIISFIPLIYSILFWNSKSPFLKKKKIIIFYLSLLFLAIPPLVFQVWSSKVRLEFMETMYLGNIFLFLCLSISKIIEKEKSLVKSTSLKKIFFLLSVLFLLIGASFVSQPLIVLYFLPIFAFFFLILFFKKIPLFKKFLFTILFFLLFLASVTIGGIFTCKESSICDLKRTISFVNGEYNDGSLNVPIERLEYTFSHIIPTFFGLKNESQKIDIISVFASNIIEIIIIISIIYLIYEVINELRSKIITIKTLTLLGIFFSLIIIYKSGFMSIHFEPRRYFPLFSFIFISFINFVNWIANFKIRSYKIGLISVILCFLFLISVNMYAFIESIFYTRFVSSYRDTSIVLSSLSENGVNKLITNSWIGGPITFQTNGNVLWTNIKVSAMPSSSGFAFNDEIDEETAIILSDVSDAKLINNMKIICGGNELVYDVYHIFFQVNKCFKNVDEIAKQTNFGLDKQVSNQDELIRNNL